MYFISPRNRFGSRRLGDGAEAKRPLMLHGAEKAEQAARGLLSVEVDPTHLLSSPYVRAFQTAERICEVLKISFAIKRCNDLLPDVLPHFSSIVAEMPPDACVICVGHEPHLSAAAGLMLGAGPVAGLAFKKAGACCIRFEGTVKPGEGILRWWLMPNAAQSFGEVLTGSGVGGSAVFGWGTTMDCRRLFVRMG